MTNKEIYHLQQQNRKITKQMQLKIFLIACFWMLISIDGQCGPIAPIIGSGSYFIQAGFSSLTTTQIIDFQNYNVSISRSHYIVFTYSMALYDLSIGLKKLNWHFDNNELVKALRVYCPTKNASSFYINIYSSFGPSVFDLEISYLAVDTSLVNYIYTPTGSSYIAISPTNGTAWSANHTMDLSYSSMSWANYKSTTKVLIYCPYYQYNPELSTANHSLGQYIELSTVSISTFILHIVMPFGGDNSTLFGLKIVYFNPDELMIDKNIILNVVFFSLGDQLTVKTLSNTSFYTNTYITGQGCDMTNNNTFIVLQPYMAFSPEMVFQFSMSSNTIYGVASNFYAINFSVIHFCSKICATAANPFLYRVDNMCYDICPDRLYGNTTTTFCELCQLNCTTCSFIQTNCTSCYTGTFLYNFTCIQNCPNTTFANALIKQCSPCEGNCLQCNIQSTNCTSCINNTFYLNFGCYYHCPAGYFDNFSTEICQTCFINCLTCTTADLCTQCRTSNLLWPNFDKCGTSCPPNYFPNFNTKMCQKIIIQGCLSALYLNGVSICLQCDVSQYFKYLSSSKSCVCKDGYKLNNETCQEYCGDGIVNNMPCDDGNFVNGDGCSVQCLVESNFNCFSVPNGPTLKSKCTYLSEINIQILSQIKMDDQNTLKLTIKINPAPLSLKSEQIKQFLNMKIENDVVNMSNLQIIYKDGIAQIYIPFTASIQNKELSLGTNFDPTKFSSSNVLISSILKGDNVALLYSSDVSLYKALGTINFSMAIFVCIFALMSSYKHKMIGLELIMPFQVILYSQSFYNLETLQTTVYTSLKPVSFSVFTPDQIGSKNNVWYKIGMTGGFLQNYNLLGLIFLISTILLIINMFKLQNGQRNRFKHKKALRDWLNFGQFKILIRQYQSIIWKYFFVSFCLSTIPLIFSISAKAMTAQPNFYPQTTMNVINDKCNYLFFLLFMGALFYTSIPRIFYNNKKNLLKKHIFKREGEKFKYDASYCMYFQLHYLFIGFIYAYCPSTLPFFYTISGINGLFFLYLVVKRPYESILDNIGALLSGSIVVYFLSINLYINIAGSSALMLLLSKISGFLITFLLFVECVVAIVRLVIFWVHDKDQNLKGLARDQKMNKFQYQKDKAFNKFVKGAVKDQEVQFHNMMNIIQGEMILNQPKTINQQLLHKIQKINSNENQETKDSIIDLIIMQQKKHVFSQQRDQSLLKRVKKNLKNSFYKQKIQQKKDKRNFL